MPILASCRRSNTVVQSDKVRVERFMFDLSSKVFLSPSFLSRSFVTDGNFQEKKISGKKRGMRWMIRTSDGSGGTDCFPFPSF